MTALDLILLLIAAANLLMAPFSLAAGRIAVGIFMLVAGLVLAIGVVMLIRYERRRGQL